MATTNEIPANAFKPSEEQLPKVDERADFVASVNADCAKLKSMAWQMRKVFAAHTALRQQVENDIRDGKKPSLDELLKSAAEFNGLEKDVLALRKSIEERVEKFNFGKSDLAARVCLTHTQEGLPISISPCRKIPLWGF